MRLLKFRKTIFVYANYKKKYTIVELSSPLVFYLSILTMNDESTMFYEKTNGVPNIKNLIIGIFEIDIAGMSGNQNFACKYF